METEPKAIIDKIWAHMKAIFHVARFLLLSFIILALMASAIGDLLDPTSQGVPVMAIFALMVGTAIVEAGVRRFWPRFYFRIGIPVASWNYSFDFLENLPTDFANISGTVKAQGMLPQVILKQLSTFEYGLWANDVAREPIRLRRKPGYNPLTRGYIYLDKENMKLKMRTYLNWTTIPFLFIWFGIAIFGPGFMLKAIFVIVGIIVFGLLLRGEIQQYLKAWNVLRRYAYGEIEVRDVAIELAKQTNSTFNGN